VIALLKGHYVKEIRHPRWGRFGRRYVEQRLAEPGTIILTVLDAAKLAVL
jgi:hypothetical protein